jgi:hypothetical protein
MVKSRVRWRDPSAALAVLVALLLFAGTPAHLLAEHCKGAHSDDRASCDVCIASTAKSLSAPGPSVVADIGFVEAVHYASKSLLSPEPEAAPARAPPSA